MSGLLSRIMLAILMLPCAAVVYICTVMLLLEAWGWSSDDTAFGLATAVSWAFIAIYWLLLWRAVPWTPTRIGLTAAAAAAALVPGVAVGATCSVVDDSFGVFIGGITAILCWLVATCFIWRESSAERAARLRRSGGETIACLQCGYNMTGLREPKCPECGGSFTLDELLRGQASREAAELSL